MSEDIVKAIMGLFTLMIFLPVFAMMISSLNLQSSQSEIQRITSEKDLQIQTITSERNTYKTDSEFYKNKYESLVNTSITKEDVTDIQANLKIVQSQLSDLHNNTNTINQNILNFYDIKNTYMTLYISIILNFVFAGFFLFDLTFLEFKVTKVVINALENRYKRLVSWINKKLNNFKKSDKNLPENQTSGVDEINDT